MKKYQFYIKEAEKEKQFQEPKATLHRKFLTVQEDSYLLFLRKHIERKQPSGNGDAEVYIG